jgi:hypothetical protein
MTQCVKDVRVNQARPPVIENILLKVNVKVRPRTAQACLVASLNPFLRLSSWEASTATSRR